MPLNRNNLREAESNARSCVPIRHASSFSVVDQSHVPSETSTFRITPLHRTVLDPAVTWRCIFSPTKNTKHHVVSATRFSSGSKSRRLEHVFFATRARMRFSEDW